MNHEDTKARKPPPRRNRKVMAQLHNEQAGQIVRSIVAPTTALGGTHEDVLVLLESVITGVVLYVVKLGGDEIVLDTVMKRVKARLAELRLGDQKPAGQA